MQFVSEHPIPELVNPQPLIDLLRGEGAMDNIWSDEELPYIWSRQLSASLIDEFKPFGAAAALIAQTLGEAADPPIRTFEHLLHHRAPPVELLRQVKEMAKRDAVDPESSLPKPITAALYHISILLGRSVCRVSIASLPDVKLFEAVRWLSNQGWLDERTVELLRHHTRRLSAELLPNTDGPRSDDAVDFE
jgi:hypothetical protein